MGVADPWGGGGGGAGRASPYFEAKLRPEGRKKFLLEAAPHPLDDRPAPASLSKGLDPPLNRTIRGVFREVRTHLFYGK